MKSKLLIIIILYLHTKWLNLFPDVWTHVKEITTKVRIGEGCWSWIGCSKLKVTNDCIRFISSSEHVVSYLRNEFVVCYLCFTRQQAKNTRNRFAVISNMNGIQLEKYLWLNDERLIIVPLSRIRKKLDNLICTKYQNSTVVAMVTVGTVLLYKVYAVVPSIKENNAWFGRHPGEENSFFSKNLIVFLKLRSRIWQKLEFLPWLFCLENRRLD